MVKLTNQMTKATLILLFLLSAVSTAIAQDTLRLTNAKSNKALTFVKGSRICYKLKGASHSKTGVITMISDSIIHFKNKKIAITNLKRIGPRMKGADVVLFGFSAISLGLMAYTYNNSINGKDHNLIATMAMVTTIGITTFIEQKNSPKKIKNKWVLSYY